MHVTVIMAVYNGALTLERAVDSIQKQSYRDWDLLIVDDGSTDETPTLLQELAESDSRINVIRNPQNRGLAASLNIALQMSRGALIARMDADDISFPYRLEHQVAFLALHPRIAVLGGGAIEVDDAGHELGSVLRPESHEELAARMYTENPFIHPTIIARREFYETLGGYAEDIGQAEDYDLWLRGYRQFRYHNLQEPLIYYRRSSRSNMKRAKYSARALLRAACREGRLLTHGWYALRPIIVTLLAQAGVWCPSWSKAAHG